MEHIKSFSFKRILLLMQKTLYENAKSVLIGLITVFGIFSFILFMSALKDGQAWSKLQIFYYIGLFIAGLFISGSAFSNFRNKEKTMSYLTLPASGIEKFISEWLLTSVVYIIAYTAIFYAFNLLVFIIGDVFNIQVNLINIFTYKTLTMFLHFIIIQSILLAGAATFKKVPLFFTISSLFIAGMIITFYITLLTLSVKGQFEAFHLSNNGIQGGDFNYNLENHWLLKVPKIMYYYITAPVFWIYTYFKLKEKEA
ncbi:MAG: hypothetical protein GXO80_02380 [Chlorobi bacterium]|nr:hypothetical protein [Chlorobiota bacterium]